MPTSSRLDAGAAQNEVNAHLGVEAGRVECGECDISLADDQCEFRAAEDYSLSAVLVEVCDLTEDIAPGGGLEDTHAELSLDHPLQFIAYRLRCRRHDLDPVMLLYPGRYEPVLHRVLGAEEADLPEVSVL